MLRVVRYMNNSLFTLTAPPEKRSSQRIAEKVSIEDSIITSGMAYPVYEGKVSILCFVISIICLVTTVPYIDSTVIVGIEIAYVVLLVLFWTTPVGRSVHVHKLQLCEYKLLKQSNIQLLSDWC